VPVNPQAKPQGDVIVREITSYISKVSNVRLNIAEITPLTNYKIVEINVYLVDLLLSFANFYSVYFTSFQSKLYSLFCSLVREVQSFLVSKIVSRTQASLFAWL